MPANVLDLNVPILGQPFKVVTIIPFVTVQCACKHAAVLTLVGLAATAACECGRAYRLVNVVTNPETGQIGAGINVGRAVSESVQ